MNRQDRRRHGKDDQGIEIIELTRNHARVAKALLEANDRVGGAYHEAQLAADLGMSVEDVQRYLQELTFWGFVEERR